MGAYNISVLLLDIHDTAMATIDVVFFVPWYILSSQIFPKELSEPESMERTAFETYTNVNKFYKYFLSPTWWIFYGDSIFISLKTRF